jgi:hypothetical protein
MCYRNQTKAICKTEGESEFNIIKYTHFHSDAYKKRNQFFMSMAGEKALKKPLRASERQENLLPKAKYGEIVYR